MNGSQKNALQYVKNTNGGATRAIFVDDHEPIGEMLWRDLEGGGYIEVNATGAVVLTEHGEAALK